MESEEGVGYRNVPPPKRQFISCQLTLSKSRCQLMSSHVSLSIVYFHTRLSIVFPCFPVNCLALFPCLSMFGCQLSPSVFTWQLCIVYLLYVHILFGCQLYLSMFGCHCFLHVWLSIVSLCHFVRIYSGCNYSLW